MRNTIHTYIVIFVSLVLSTCVTIRRQLIMQDLQKKSLKEIHATDTIITCAPFVYRLKPKDIISIEIVSLTKNEYNFEKISSAGETGLVKLKQGDFSQINDVRKTGYMIDSNGYVHIPAIGKVAIGAKTIDEARNILQTAINKYMDNCVVQIAMQNYYVYMYGEINTPGKIISDKAELTVLEAIMLAGGFKEYANRRKVKIIRPLAGNKMHIRYINLLDQSIACTKDFYLLPGDMLIIEPMRAKNLRAYSLTNITIAASSISLLISIFFATNALRNFR